MIKRLILVCITLCVLTSCSSKTVSSSVSKTDMIATEIITSLQMSDMVRVKDRVVIGMIMNGDKDSVKQASLYRSSQEGNYDMVGVFYPTDMQQAQLSIQSYLSDLKDECNVHYPQEVFKISNVVEKHDDTCIIFVVCTDIEEARKIVEQYISE